MRLPERDIAATGLVALAGILYVLWAAGAAPPGLGGTRATGLVVLGLGFAASASAVVPGFDELIRGNKIYVAVTSAIGLVAFAGGLQMLLTASEVGLGVMMAAMGLLWLVATVHHVLLARHASAPTRPRLRPRPQGPGPAAIS